MTFYVGHKQLSVVGEAGRERESGIGNEIGPEITEETGIGNEGGRGRGKEYVIGTETEGKEEDTEDNVL